MTFTFSRRAPVAWTATIEVGLWSVVPFKGTIVTSESKPALVSTVVVLETPGVGRVCPPPPVVIMAATTPATRTAPRAQTGTSTFSAGPP
jgi:hypothetical protein